MAGGGGTNTVTQTSLPGYAEPYYKTLMNRAEFESAKKFDPYEGDQTANINSLTRTGLNQLGAMDGKNTQTIAAGDRLSDAASVFNQLQGTRSNNMNYQSGNDGGQITNGGTVTPGANLTSQNVGASMSAVDNWGMPQANAYMSPYMSAVVDRQKESAIRDYNRGKSDRNTRAINAGAFGGSRQAVADYLETEGLQNRLADIDAEGRQAAWTQAQQQFNTDQGRSLQSQTSNFDRLLNAGVGNADRALRAGEGNRSAGMQAQISNADRSLQALQSNAQRGQLTSQQNADRWLQYQKQQQDADFGAAGIRQQAGSAMADLGSRSQALGKDIEGMQRQAYQDRIAAGKEFEGYEQKDLDVQYQKWTDWQDSTRNNLAFLAGIMNGVPTYVNSRVSSTQQQNPLTAGLGGMLGMGGLWNAQGYS